jgi:hypothetical protein
VDTAQAGELLQLWVNAEDEVLIHYLGTSTQADNNPPLVGVSSCVAWLPQVGARNNAQRMWKLPDAGDFRPAEATGTIWLEVV